MNERFNQLLKQVEEETNAEYQDESRRKRRLYNEILLPKFAELIVQECMACSIWVGKMNTNSVEPIHTAHAINQRIKQQFGVEE